MKHCIECVCMLMVSVVLTGCVSAPKPVHPVAERLLAEGYPCYAVPGPIVLDGHLSDPAWTNAPILDFYLPPDFGVPKFKTEARVLYDSHYIYVGFKAQDLDIWGYYTNRDDPTCVDDCLEFFFQTDPSGEAYYGFEINVLGTVNDSCYPLALMAGGGHRRWNKWDCEGVQVQVGVAGSLNNPDDEDQFWILEMAIPFAGLPTLAGQSPQPGDAWRFHLARCEYGICFTNRGEFTSCAPLPQASFHVNENWLKLNFDCGGATAWRIPACAGLTGFKGKQY